MKLQRFREGAVAQEIKGLRRPSQGSARADVYATIIDAHKKYSKHVQDFVDTVTPDQFRLWYNGNEGSKGEKAYVPCCSTYMLNELARYRDSLGLRRGCGARSTCFRAWRRRPSNSPLYGTFASEQGSMMDHMSSAICV